MDGVQNTALRTSETAYEPAVCKSGIQQVEYKYT